MVRCALPSRGMVRHLIPALATWVCVCAPSARAVTLTRLTYDDRDENWSTLAPDGHAAMYSSGPVICDNEQWFCGAQTIWRIDLEGDSVPLSSTLMVDKGFHPRWSPDGQWVAGMVHNGSDYDVHVWPATDMSGPGLVFQSTVGADERFPNWSPDSQQLAFDSNRLNPRQSNYQVFYAPLNQPNDPAAVVRVTFIGTNNRHPSWNNDGTEIAYVGDAEERRSISAVRLSDGRYRKITPHASQNRHPDWSPDGQWILWTTDRWDGKGDIAIARADGLGDPVRVTVGMNGHDDFAEWALDSQRIIFCGTALDLQTEPNKEVFVASDLPFAEAAVPTAQHSIGELKASMADRRGGKARR